MSHIRLLAYADDKIMLGDTIQGIANSRSKRISRYLRWSVNQKKTK